MIERVDIVIGLQYGDEGKGRLGLQLAEQSRAHSVNAVRWNGGPNAGHTVYHKGQKIVCRHLPAAGISDKVRYIIIGPNVVIDPQGFIDEVNSIDINLWSKIWIHPRATAIREYHKQESEFAKNTLGTTGNGIGPAYASSVSRTGDSAKEEIMKLLAAHNRTAAGDLYRRALQALEYTCFLPYRHVMDAVHIIAEGAQATMLDNLFGTYPYVTSSQCIAPSFFSSMGLGHLITSDEVSKNVYGVMKPYTTRVGNGPLQDEYPSSLVLDHFVEVAGEFGSVTGRKRRIAPLNLADLKEACLLNGVTHLVVTKMDLLPEFEKLCPDARQTLATYVDCLEEKFDLELSMSDSPFGELKYFHV